MRPLVMGVLNVTPDSFSDGGRYLDPERAIARGLEMAAEGADIVDVGGESSRPGAEPVPAAEERRRVLPVVAALAGAVRVSIDTAKREVAWAAIEAGATLVNDITASLYDVAAEAGCGFVAMHMRGTPASMQRDPRYGDVVAEVREFLARRAERAAEAGVKEVFIDPGIGFGKTARHNLELLARLDELVALGWPVLVGTSRKSFLGPLSALPNGPVPPPADRLEASLATALFAIVRGAAMVRVHDVAPTVAAVKLFCAPLPPGQEVGAGQSGARTGP